MADWYNDIIAEIRTLAIATLTEITFDTFHTVVQSLRQNVVSEAAMALSGDTTRNPPPYLIIQIGTDQIARDMDPSARYYRLPFRFYYLIDQTPSGDIAALDPPAYCRSRLEVLRLALQDIANLDTCQWTGEDGEIDSSENVAFANENLNLFAAELTFDVGFLTVLS